MCFFPIKNNQINSIAYKKGVKEYECGACPECLSKKSRQWALRCAAEAEDKPAVMVCLTYDSYIHDKHGRIVGERVADLAVNKKDCQDFVKRLRRHFDYHYGNKDIKYLITAEYGSRTHRPHYHAILFNVQFDDLVPYKKSKRGNLIYKSATLEKLWKHGICTVDCVNPRAAAARYCTKYAMKDKGADTFMLFSRGIGDGYLLRNFNGLSYMIDGREYPIPRLIWRRFLANKYGCVSPTYVSPADCSTALENKLKKLLAAYSANHKRIKALDECYAVCLERIQKHLPQTKPLSLCAVPRRLYIAAQQEKAAKLLALVRDLMAQNVRLNDVYKSLYKQLRYKPTKTYRRYINENDKLNALDVFLGTNIIAGISKPSDCGTCDERRRRRYASRKSIFDYARDNDTQYKRYLLYWQKKAAAYELERPDVCTRINLLPVSKYFDYKSAALSLYQRRLLFKARGIDSDCAGVAPRSNNLSRVCQYLHKICPAPLVIKGQMTQSKNESIKIPPHLFPYYSRSIADWPNPPRFIEQIAIF